MEEHLDIMVAQARSLGAVVIYQETGGGSKEHVAEEQQYGIADERQDGNEQQDDGLNNGAGEVEPEVEAGARIDIEVEVRGEIEEGQD